MKCFLGAHLLVYTVIVHVPGGSSACVEIPVSAQTPPVDPRGRDPCNKVWMCQDFSALTASQRPFAQ